MRIRAAVRAALRSALPSLSRQGEDPGPHGRPLPLVLVALSGGADSLALAAAMAAEAAGTGVRAGAAIVDHGLQPGSEAAADRAAGQAASLGLDPVIVQRVEVESGPASVTGGVEASARAARYEALRRAAEQTGAICVLTAHTRDDQAEQVLLGLARGSGTRSLAGIPVSRMLGPGLLVLRPLLDERAGIDRATTEAACAELGLEPWTDPHNSDPSFARVRVRARALPLLERQLGPGFADALARTADLAREDADALDELARERLRGIPAPDLSVAELASLPAALRHRMIRLAASEWYGSQLSREHTLAIAALVTAWRGQGPIHVPGLVVSRAGDRLTLAAREAPPAQ